MYFGELDEFQDLYQKWKYFERCQKKSEIKNYTFRTYCCLKGNFKIKIGFKKGNPKRIDNKEP